MPLSYYLIAAAIGIVLIVITKKWTIGILITYMFLIFAATVLTRKTEETAKYHFELFWSYGNSFRYQNQIVANIVMFVPIGILFGFEKKWFVLFGILFSFLIEVTQLITHRGMFELDDIFHNTVGLMIGFLCVVGIKKIITLFEGRKK